MKKDLKNIINMARDQGWCVEKTGGGHWKFYPPDRSLSAVVTASTPSDHRGLKNLIADLRRRGFVWRQE